MADETIKALAVQVALEDGSFQAGMQNLQRTMTNVDSQFKSSISGVRNWGDNLDSLKANSQALGEKINVQNQIIAKFTEQINKSKDALEQNSQKMLDNKSKLDAAKTAYDESTATLGKNADETKKLKEQLDAAQKAYESSEKTVLSNNKTVQSYTTQLNNAKGKLNSMTAELTANDAKVKANSGSWGKLTDAVASTSEKANSALKKMGLAIGGMVASMGAMLMSSGENADEIDKLSAKTGISTDRLQELQYAGVKTKVDLETLASTQAKLTKNMQAAENGTKTQVSAFKELGVSLNDNNGKLKNSSDVYTEVINALGKMEAGTRRDQIAMDLFGKSGTDLNYMIETGGDAIKQYSEEAEKNGAVMSGPALAGLDDFADSVSQLKLGIQSMIGQSLSKLTPELTKVSENLRNLDTSKIQSAISFVLDHSGAVLAAVTGITGAVVAWKVATIAAAAAQEIHNAVVVISTAATDGLAAAQVTLDAANGGTVISTIALTAAQVGQKVAAAAAAAGQWLLNAALTANPIGIVIVAIAALVAALVLLFNNNKQFHDWVIGAFNNIKNAAQAIGTWFSGPFVNFFKGAWSGIQNAFNVSINFIKDNWKQITMFLVNPVSGAVALLYNNNAQFREWAKSLGTAIHDGFDSAIAWIKALPAEALQWGKDIINGIVDGIKSAASAVGDAVKGVAQDIRKFLHFSVPDEGPLVDFNSWMPDMMAQMASGISDNKYKVQDAIRSLSGDISVGVKTTTQPATSGSSSTGSAIAAAVKSGNVVINNSFAGETPSAAEHARKEKNMLRQLALQF